MNLSNLFKKALFLSVIIASAPAVFAAAITTSFSPAGPVTVGATITVTVSMGSYSAADEIDGYEFKVDYPPALFSLVGGSALLNDGSGFGALENWLRKAPQDLVGAGAILTDGTTTSPGTVNISVADLRGASVRGTTSASGFLYSFDLLATGTGIGSITPSAPASGDVLFDVALSPVSPAPTFSGVPVTVVPEPSLCGLLLAGGGFLTLRARRSRRQ